MGGKSIIDLSIAKNKISYRWLATVIYHRLYCIEEVVLVLLVAVREEVVVGVVVGGGGGRGRAGRGRQLQ